MANGNPTPRARKPKAFAVLTTDQILAADDVKEDTLEVSEWGGTLKLRGFRLSQRLKMEEAWTGEDGLVDEREMIKQYLLNGVVEPELDEETVEQILEQKAQRVVNRVFAAIAVLNGGDSAAAGSAADFFLAEPDTE